MHYKEMLLFKNRNRLLSVNNKFNRMFEASTWEAIYSSTSYCEEIFGDSYVNIGCFCEKEMKQSQPWTKTGLELGISKFCFKPFIEKNKLGKTCRS